MKEGKTKLKESKKYSALSRGRETFEYAQFRRPLQWMNKILDILIQNLKCQLKFGAPVSAGTKNLVPLCIEFKKRAIREGFENWFPERISPFLKLYEDLEKIDRELDLARKLAYDREECQARLGKAHNWKYKLIENHFPDFFGESFLSWYSLFMRIDMIIERLIITLRSASASLTQKQLEDMIADLRSCIFMLITLCEVAKDTKGDGQNEEILVDVGYFKDDCSFLLEWITKGKWKIELKEDRDEIKRMLLRLRSRKYNIIDRFGSFGNRTVFEWYKALFKIDYLIQNAADQWVDGRILPEWDQEVVVKIIDKAIRAKLSFIDLFPERFRLMLSWLYKKLYEIDLLLDKVNDLLKVGKIREALKLLEKTKKLKDTLERRSGLNLDGSVIDELSGDY